MAGVDERSACSRVDHLTMRFGGLVAIGDLSFTAGRNDITALIGPNGAGKTTVFNCITGFYKPTEGHDRACAIADGTRIHPRAHGRFPHRPACQGGAHLPEHPPVRRHDRARKSDRRPAQHADARLGLHGRRHSRPRAATAGPSRKRSRRPNTGSTRSISSIAPTIRRATCPMAPSAGSRSRAPCAPSPCSSASTSRPPASIRANPRSSTSCCSRSATSRRSASC